MGCWIREEAIETEQMNFSETREVILAYLVHGIREIIGVSRRVASACGQRQVSAASHQKRCHSKRRPLRW